MTRRARDLRLEPRFESLDLAEAGRRVGSDITTQPWRRQEAARLLQHAQEHPVARPSRQPSFGRFAQRAPQSVDAHPDRRRRDPTDELQRFRGGVDDAVGCVDRQTTFDADVGEVGEARDPHDASARMAAREDAVGDAAGRLADNVEHAPGGDMAAALPAGRVEHGGDLAGGAGDRRRDAGEAGDARIEVLFAVDDQGPPLAQAGGNAALSLAFLAVDRPEHVARGGEGLRQRRIAAIHYDRAAALGQRRDEAIGAQPEEQPLDLGPDQRDQVVDRRADLRQLGACQYLRQADPIRCQAALVDAALPRCNDMRRYRSRRQLPPGLSQQVADHLCVGRPGHRLFPDLVPPSHSCTNTGRLDKLCKPVTSVAPATVECRRPHGPGHAAPGSPGLHAAGRPRS